MATPCEVELDAIASSSQGPSGYTSLAGAGLGQRTGRLVRAVGLAAALLGAAALGLAASRASRAPEKRTPGAFLEQSWSWNCVGPGENCWGSKCCKDPSSTCFAKDHGWAVCKQSCTPGPDNAWSCAVVRPAQRCSDAGESCAATKCCKDSRMRCFYKDPGWAECKMSCTPGFSPQDPKKQMGPWSCTMAGTQPKPLQAPSPVPKAAKVANSSSSGCTAIYGNCKQVKCCADTTVAVSCFKRDDTWSECRESCPLDERWACSREVELLGPGNTSHSESKSPKLVAKEGTGQPLVLPSGPSLYCFSLMLPWGNEVSLVRTQLAKGVGIFDCDAWDVISNESAMLTPGPPVRIEASVMSGSLKCQFGGEYNTALNSEIFYRVWQKVISLGHYKDHDWTAKLDPDAVFLPWRLRTHVRAKSPTEVVYLNNCDEGLHGPIEVISNGGMQVFAKGVQQCKNSLQQEWMTYGEDVWLRRCWGLLGVGRADDYTLLREKACKPFKNPIPCFSGAVAFHPLKTPARYFGCYYQAYQQAKTQGEVPPERPQTTTSTTTEVPDLAEG